MAKHRTKRSASVTERPTLEQRHTVARYSSPLEAHMVRGLLEAQGIGCVLSNELFNVMDSPVAVATGGVSVQVREADLARAADILRAQTNEGQEEPEAPWARSRKSSRQAWLAVVLLSGLSLSFLWSLYKNLMSLAH